MRLRIFLGISIAFLWATRLYAQPLLNTAKVDSSLQERMLSFPDIFHPVSIHLTQQTDLNALREGFLKQQAPLHTQVPALISHLQANASSTQQGLLSMLSGSKKSVKQKTIRSFWITNVIYVHAQAELIYRLSQRPDVAWIDRERFTRIDDANLSSETYLDLETTKVGGHESGHDAIQAPALWAMGYTGYSRSVLTIDNGVILEHPALTGSYRGMYVPDGAAWFDPGGSPTPTADNSHGTHVTGIMTGLDPATQDTIGVAFNGLWMGAPAIGKAESAAVAALQWALNPDGDPNTVDDMPDVINNSWSADATTPPGQDCNSIFKNILDVLEAAGIAVVFSAGNNGPSAQSISSPKNINTNAVNSFCVGAVNGKNPAHQIVAASGRGPSRCGGLSPLLIKPEVMAPGRTIRSSGRNGTYPVLTGTSFAAPHVSGAVLLLKEAFPYLTGKDLLLALYHSCKDLGAPGEDNDFGMGIIQVKAAFDTLVAQGHTPVPVSFNNDAAIEWVTAIEPVVCDGITTPTLELINRGSDTLTAVMVVYHYSSLPPDTLFWTGALAPEQKDTLMLPAQFLSAGYYEFSITLPQVNGSPDYHFLDNTKTHSFTVLDNELPTTDTLLICQGSQALLRAPTSGPAVFWYRDEADILPFSFADQQITPILEKDTTFYAATGFTHFTGKKDTIGDTGNTSKTGQFLSFDCARDIILRSVLVYSSDSGSHTIELKNRYGNPIANREIQVMQGAQRVELDMAIPAGKFYQIGLSDTTAGLFTSLSGVSFPYELPGAMSITGSGLAQAYPYFYDWEVAYASCKVAVPVQIASDSVDITFMPRDTQIYLGTSGEVRFIAEAPGANSWFWDFGDGQTDTVSNPLHTYSEPGIYEVTLAAAQPSGCLSVVSDTILANPGSVGITDHTAWPGNMQVFPNPSGGIFHLELELLRPYPIAIRVIDIYGRSLHSQTYSTRQTAHISLDLSAFTPGIYFLETRIGEFVKIDKLVKTD